MNSGDTESGYTMRTALACFLLLLPTVLLVPPVVSQQVTTQDLDQILERADKIVEEAKTAYETGRTTSSVDALLGAAFKLEEARIKYLVLQEIGGGEKQKIAADRLRAVNQLNKLVNDAKVAIAGTPAPVPAAKPADPAVPPPAVEAPQKPAEPPAKAGEVAKRAPIPEGAKLKEAEKLIKDIFKEQYAKKSHSERKGLVRVLLEQTRKNQDDQAAIWVLCKEAQDIAVQVCDIKSALEAVEAAGRMFDIDVLVARTEVLVALGKVAKSTEEFAALAGALLALVNDLVEADQYEAADKMASTALQHARKTKDIALASRATTRAREVSEAKSIFQSMKTSRETLAKNADDPRAYLEIGQFQCFVKGNWDLGLRFMSKGSDPTIKALAEKELARPTQASDVMAIAEGWEDLAEKEKGALRKSQLLTHARALYEAALPNATGLLRAKIEKRVAELATKANPVSASVTGGTDLLALVDAKKDTFAGAGTWERAGSRIHALSASFGRIEIPYEPPDEYDLKVVVEAGPATEAVLLLSRQGRAFALSIYPGQDRGAIYSSVPAAAFSGIPLPTDRPLTLVAQVRAESVKVFVDDKPCLDWKPEPSTVGPHQAWQPRNAKWLGLGATGAKVSFVSAQVVEITGKGKKAR